MNFSKEDIIKYADKLLIGLSEEEANMILSEFKEIDDHINNVNKIENLDKVIPASMPYDLYQANLREDISYNDVSIDDLLKNCKDTDGREIKVSKVVSNE